MDNSATSFPKPKSVLRAVNKALTNGLGNPGRSNGAVFDTVFSARERLGKFVGSAPENIIFTYNATHALNIALKGVITPEMTVAYDPFAHNSVLRVLYGLEKSGTTLRLLKADLLRDSVIIASFEKLLRKERVDVLVVTHTSNVTGKILPVKRLGRLCRAYGVIMIVDGSQGVGACKIDMERDMIDLLASSGHKGLYGIMGSGFLAVNKGFKGKITPLLLGGSGIMSLSKAMPDELPERLEAGTIGLPAVVSMSEGAEYIMRVTPEAIAEREELLRARLIEGLSLIRGVRVYNADVNAKSIVLFNLNSMHPSAVSDELSRSGIVFRQGFHCAPLAHDMISRGSKNYDGALRLSVGYFNTLRECDRVLGEINRIVKFN